MQQDQLAATDSTSQTGAESFRVMAEDSAKSIPPLDAAQRCVASQLRRCLFQKGRLVDPLRDVLIHQMPPAQPANLGKPRWPCAATESRIIHSPDFDCTVAPHLSLSSRPALSAVCVAIKAQNIHLRIAFGSCQAGLRDPYFQLSVLGRNRFPNRATRIDRCSCQKQNQMVRQMTEKHHSEVYNPDCEQPPERWQNS